ncbi:hypothetical protein BBJ28_00004759 [Nothophytophthora sp. Chile5]|nr:hypothetical protein BBJ28_00004759 [Nothophytophthora sp. Chile5]
MLVKNESFEASCVDYVARRQEAVDHGQKLTLDEIHPLPVTKGVQLPAIAHCIALSLDELLVAVAYGDAVALFEVAEIVESVLHHINWAEDDLILAGYQKYDAEEQETTALACLYENGGYIELDEVVAFYDVENRCHQYFSVFLPDWRMFFVGCSLSADIELLVSDPDGGEWELWKPSEKYQARLPMNAQDEESFPMGLAINLNSTAQVPVEEDAFPPVPIVSCTNTEGLLVNFAFIDTTVRDELEFVKRPEPFVAKVTRSVVVKQEPEARATVVLAQDVENVPASEDSDEDNSEEEAEEERQNAITAFDAVDEGHQGEIEASKFPELIEELGTTYCAPDHERFANKLTGATGMIRKDDFVEWYVLWLFGEDESDEEVDESSLSATESQSTTAKANGLEKFLMKEGSWRCAECYSQNSDPDAPRCASCETKNPNFKGVTPAAATKGFSFDGPAKPSTNFSFGFDAGTISAPEEKPSISFGFTPQTKGSAKTGGFKLASKPAAETTSATPSFGFGFTPATEGNGKAPAVAGGFQFAAKSTPEAAPPTTASGFQFKPSPASPKVNVEVSASPEKSNVHAYGQNDENEFAESDGEESDEEEERKEEEKSARVIFRSIASDDADYIDVKHFPRLFKALGSTYSEEAHAKTLERLDKDGKVYERDFIPWYVDYLFNDDESDEDEEASKSAAPKKQVSHAYGQNDENQFAESDGDETDDDAERKEEEDKVRKAFRSIATDGADYIEVEHFPKLFKTLGATYSEEAHVNTLQKLDKGGKVYERDFISWYVDWLFGDGDSDEEEEDADDSAATTGTKKTDMKSKEEIAAALSKFMPKEGSWKCAVCMVSNGPDATKCTSCETPNPKAPQSLAPAKMTAATSAGSIGAGGFSFPTATAATTKSSFSFGFPSSATGDTSKPTGFSFTPSKTATPFAFEASAKPSTGFSFESAGNTKSKPAADGYPPDTTSKPKPPAFGAAASGYPPDTTSKPKPPAFGGAGSGYPPDTTSKPKPPAFGGGGSGYPPDTTAKPKPPAFGGGGSGYPPDTTAKPKPPAFGGGGSGYPPDTTAKPKPPAFGAAGSGYPPDTTKRAKPPAFGEKASGEQPTSSFGFGSFGKSLFGSTQGSVAMSAPSWQASDATSSSGAVTPPPKPKSLFGSAFGGSGASEKAADTSSSPFGIVPNGNAKSAFSFSARSAADSKEMESKTSAKRPSFSFTSVSSTLPIAETKETSAPPAPLQTKRTLTFGDTSTFDAKAKSLEAAKSQTPDAVTLRTKPAVTSVKTSKAMPSSQMEGQLWKLIVDFDKSFQRVNRSSKVILPKDVDFTKKFVAKMDTLHAQIAGLCELINTLDDSREQIEKDVLFVIGSDGDVHEQLEYGREILISFNDEALKRSLEEQPLDQRSEETRIALREKVDEMEKRCLELESFLASSKISANGTSAVSSAHLFRVLKQTYENSKMQYNNVCKLAEQLDKLSMRGERLGQTNGVSGLSSVEAESRPMTSKVEMVQMITEAGQRSQDVRRHFLSLCNNVVTPRDVFSTPRRKLAATTPSASSSPLRIKAYSKLMPKTQLTVASPLSSAKRSSGSISFKGTPVKAGSKLFSLAEEMAPKEPAKFVQTPQPSKNSVGVGRAPQRPSLGVPAVQAKPPSMSSSSTASKPNAFSFPKPSSDKPDDASAEAGDKKRRSTGSSFGANSLVAKPDAAFSLGGKDATAPSSSGFGFSSKGFETPTKSPVAAVSTTPDYKTLLENFCKEHNPSKASNAEKALAGFKGREEDLFTRLFTVYVPDSTSEDVKKYLSGGPLPKKASATTTAAKPLTPAEPAAKSSFGGFGVSKPAADSAAKDAPSTPTPSPFGASPSAFTLGPSASKPSTGFGGFASGATPPTAAASSFGTPAVNYRQKLEEFYQKYNPSKLSSVEATLAKYKGNEEKLFQNLAAKYKVGAPGAGVPAAAGQPVAAASPFGKPGAFSAPSGAAGATFGSASSVGFGTPKPAAASPFAAAPQTPSGFGSTTGGAFGGGFQTPAAAPAFGSPSPFGAATTGGFGAPAGGVNYREKLAAFYQQHNPGKLGSVEATLVKYKGQEDRLFAMLEQKYLGKPAAPAPAGGFGIPSSAAFGGGSGFGTPSALGGATGAPAFGAASSLGAAAQPAFGGSVAPSFGAASRMGGGSGFGVAAPAASSGPATGSGFSAFGSQQPAFGAQPPQTNAFGGAAAGNSFGSGFGGAASTGGFGQPAAFGNPSFTQMR